ncbi:DUF4249 domain-containing protein [Paracrocinitomix mangrovi]|uniref:DUF4249 domain-containing protein n=1 Tax=Paracrocinitomix mangrovi TaxID=2862509 RepID=UPI001C8ECE2A|nr:DUF4249 domain-containing protein [Paracrocinitomix mangrovi]UKN01013.1 DUF4249 domain-containing protein [Paracrocinitomix mangrovi]
MRNYLIFISSLFVVMLNSCTKDIDIELDEGDEKLVIDAWFTTEQKVHEIRLTKTAAYFSNESVPVASGATVEISGGGQIFPFMEVSPGIYQSDANAKAEMGTEYTLTVMHEGEVYTAKDYCDTVPTLNQLELSPVYNSQNELRGYQFLIWTTELSGYGHYYCWRILNNGIYVTDTLSEISIETDDYLGDGLTFEAFPIDYISVNDCNPGDTLTLEQHNISKQTYDAFIGILSETAWSGGIFAAPPANAPTNVDNGGLGLFVVSALSKQVAIVPN